MKEAGFGALEARLCKLGGFLRAFGQVRRREFLFRKPLGQFRIRLIGSGDFAAQCADGSATEPKGKNWLSVHPIQQERIANLGNDCDRVHFFALASNRGQVRRSGDVQVPNIVADFLKMPEALARPGIERDQAVGEHVIAAMPYTDEIGLGGTGGHVGDAADFVHGHAAPTIRRVSLRLVPRVESKLPRLRHRMERPAQLAGDDIETPDILLKPRHDNGPLEDGRGRSRRAEISLGNAWE